MKMEDRGRKGEAAGRKPEAAGFCPRITGHEWDPKRDPSRLGTQSRATTHGPRATGHESRATTCSHCVYARRPTGRWLRLILSRWMGLLICTNHPDAPGDILGVPACSRCRNFRPRPLPVERVEIPEPVGPLVCTIPLTQKKVAIVDAADYPWLSRYRWHAVRLKGSFYAYRSQKGRRIAMHRQIMEPPPGMVVDHSDGDSLNNCRWNLRVCTLRQNAWNRRRKKRLGATAQFIGVYRRKGQPDKWYGRVECDGEETNLGPFESDIEAARARDRKAIELFGPYAMLNFPEEREQRVREIEEERGRTESGESDA